MACPCCSPAGTRAGLSRRALLGGTGAATALATVPAAAAGPLDGLLGALVSPEQERRLGAQAFAQLKRERPRTRDQRLQRRLETVGERIIGASGSDIPPSDWRLVVFRGEEINAFALPGGKVGFFEGIFRVADDDAKLATVLGHEVGHVTARHHAERMGADVATGVGTAIVGQLLGLDPASGADRLLGSVLGAGVQYGVLMPYGRGQELEADRLGLETMARAGYDPTASLAFWDAMARAGGAKPPAFLSTHPSDAERIRRLEAELPAAIEVYTRTRR